MRSFCIRPNDLLTKPLRLIALLFTITSVASAEEGQQQPVLPEELPVVVSEQTPTPIPFPTLTPDTLLDFKLSGLEGLKGRLAFTATVAGYDRILVLDFESQIITPIVDGPGNNSYPSWNHNGTLLSFTSDRDGNREIYIADWDGTNQRRVTKSPFNEDHASWAPDGKRLVFDTELSSSVAVISSIDLDGTNQIQIGEKSGRNTVPRWSPDGRMIAYSTNRFWPGWDVCIWDLERQAESCPLSGRQSYCRAEWSHSGNFLAFSSGIGNEINLGLVEIKKQRSSDLAAFPGREYDACWSPSDTHVAFAAENGTANGIFNLFIANVASEKSLQAIKAPYPIRYLSWAQSSTLELEAKRLVSEQKKSETKQPEVDSAGAAPSVTTTPTAPTAPSAQLTTEQLLLNPPAPEPTRYVPPYLRDTGSWEKNPK